MPDSRPEIAVLDDPAAAVGDLIATRARQGGSIVLTGGSTPGKAYMHAAELAPDWSGVTVWWSDERCVPADDERSNYRFVKDTLLGRLATQPRDVRRIRGEIQPADAADEYDLELVGAELDLLLLGLGRDGHTASLFPGSPQLDVEDRRAISGPAGLEPWVDRVTMTLPTLRSAHRILFLVTGGQKSDAVAAAFGGGISRDVPASMIRLAPVPVEVFLDAPAAARLAA